MRPAWWHEMNRYQRNKEPGILTGVRSICKYMQIGPHTFSKLYTFHGLPAMRLPDGRWSTSKNLIDDWIVAQWKAQTAGLTKPSECEAPFQNTGEITTIKHQEA